MRVKKNKWRRLRADGAYIFASMLGLFGGLVVLGSYAAHKPPATMQPGTYSLTPYATAKPGEYRIGVKQGLSYCVEPPTPAVPCFIARNTDDAYVVHLPGGYQAKSLVVKE